MQKVKFFIFTFVILALIAACTPKVPKISEIAKSEPTRALEEYRMPTDVPSSSDLTTTAEAEITAAIPPADCPVTLPSKITFKAPEPYSADAPWPGIFWHGTEHLWTALHTNGVWENLPQHEYGYGQKIMWWSDFYVLKDELEPALVVSAQRLDGDAPPFEFEGATNASAQDIGDAMLTGVTFPTAGCWEVTGRYKKTGLTFVVWIAP